MSNEVVYKTVDRLHQLFQPMRMPPNQDWSIELQRERPDYYPEYYVEDARGGYVLKPALPHLVVTRIPIQLEVAAQNMEECEAVLRDHLDGLVGLMVDHIDWDRNGFFYPDDQEAAERLVRGQTVLTCVKVEGAGRDEIRTPVYVREGSCVMLCSGGPTMTSAGDGKIQIAWEVGLAVLDGSGIGIGYDRTPYWEHE